MDRDQHFRATLFGSMAMVILAVVLAALFSVENINAQWFVITVGVVAVGQLLGFLAASMLGRYERGRADR